MEGAGAKLPDQWLLEKKEGGGDVRNRRSGTGLPRLCKDGEVFCSGFRGWSQGRGN